jgi:transcriptional regulator with XRE-family HTH domain
MTATARPGQAANGSGPTPHPVREPIVLHQLRTLRQTRGLSQDAFASVTGIPVPGIARLEAGGSTRHWEVPLIAAALDVTADVLLGAERDPTPAMKMSTQRLVAAITAELAQLQYTLVRLAQEQVVLAACEAQGHPLPATARRTAICMTIVEVRRQCLLRERAEHLKESAGRKFAPGANLADMACRYD